MASLSSTPPSLVNVIRILAADAVQRANSGHPGMPMGMAEIAVALWHRCLKHNPLDPTWLNRDRFILSNGHGSMLLYALLHLTGYDLSIEELKNFRQLHSKTPGHPEFGLTPGVETTTGPLGQGLANAVGMALAEKLLGQTFNRPNLPIIDHYTYVFLGDGCLMEGISHEVASLAGTWRLGKLICLYDDNGISIDGQVQGWFTDDTAQRFIAYGWQVIANVDGHDVEAVTQALQSAQLDSSRPSLIICKTTIGKGAPTKAGSADVHGAPLGTAEVSALRESLDWTYPPFEIPEDIRQAWDARAVGATRQAEWQKLWVGYQKTYPDLARELQRRISGDLPEDWLTKIPHAEVWSPSQNTEPIAAWATRKASQWAITELARVLPEFLGGSADLTGSNLTQWPQAITLESDKPGNYIHYGVREFGMAAIMNGLALYGGFIPFGGTFLTFSDYARNALRMAALMRLRVIHVFTHDSIGVGEDGPTHQPIEHAASLRLIPNLTVWRPCDQQETYVAWLSAIERRDGPTALLLTRQNVPAQLRDQPQVRDIQRGGYILSDPQGNKPQALIIASGSEIAVAIEAQKILANQGISVRVVSMPAPSVFDQQEPAYKQAVLPLDMPKVAIEAGVTHYWYKYVGTTGVVLGIDTFGESAPAHQLFEYFGLTAPHLVKAVQGVLA